MKLLQIPLKYRLYPLLLLGCIFVLNTDVLAQDSSKSILDINNTKLIKKVNSVLDSNQKKINNFLFKKIDNAKAKLDALSSGSATTPSTSGARTPQDVANDFKSGKITREQAEKELRDMGIPD